MIKCGHAITPAEIEAGELTLNGVTKRHVDASAGATCTVSWLGEVYELCPSCAESFDYPEQDADSNP